MEWTRITLFHIVWFVAVIAGASIGGQLGSTWGRWGAVGGGLAGLLLGHVLGSLPSKLAWKSLMKEIETSSNEKLWEIVHLGFWNMSQTMALLQLLIRDQDVRGELPRIIRMLEHEDELERVYGWDALRLVFTEEYQLIEDYEPRGPAGTCRELVARLKQALNAED